MKNDTRYRACDGLSDKKLTTTVEADDRLEGDPFLGGTSLNIIGLSGIEGSHVCLVVLRVVERHDLLRDVGLERIVVVREGGKTVSHLVGVVMERESERVMWRARTDIIPFCLIVVSYLSFISKKDKSRIHAAFYGPSIDYIYHDTYSLHINIQTAEALCLWPAVSPSCPLAGTETRTYVRIRTPLPAAEQLHIAAVKEGISRCVPHYSADRIRNQKLRLTHRILVAVAHTVV